MNLLDVPPSALPDVASTDHPRIRRRLDWVGMRGIELPIRVSGADGQTMIVPARVDALVDLVDPAARGIHMSRLYQTVDRVLGQEVLAPAVLRQVLEGFLASHRELSTRALLRITFEYLVRRPALVSDRHGWRAYPAQVRGELDPRGFLLEVGARVLYSSTCPSSAALARQCIQSQCAADFGADPIDPKALEAWLGSERGVSATPHSQRSSLWFKVQLTPELAHLALGEWLDRVEAALATPVQAAVKREDEQAFARLNGANLMFCEDAGRRVADALEHDPRVLDYWLMAAHHESLHPHDAVVVVTKGVRDGYRAD